MSITINFAYQNSQHKALLELTDFSSEKSVSIAGKFYKIVSGAYKAITDPKTFAEAVTADIRLISEDKHIYFDLLEQQVVESEQKITEIKQTEERYPIPELVNDYEYQSHNSKAFPYELKSGYLKNDTNIGYLDLQTFGNCKAESNDDIDVKEEIGDRRNAFVEAVTNLGTATSIIIDLRNNGGGDPNAVQLLCSLFMNEGFPLNTIEWRNEDSFTTEIFDTLSHEDLPEEVRLLKQKVFVLIGAVTFSAAEECANNMKVLEKATIIGEPSGGGANPGGYKPIGKNFDIKIPSGRAINPLQEGNWEGVRIIPDHVVLAKDALETAISLTETKEV